MFVSGIGQCRLPISLANEGHFPRQEDENANDFVLKGGELNVAAAMVAQN
jgi:hypothetical protein